MVAARALSARRDGGKRRRHGTAAAAAAAERAAAAAAAAATEQRSGERGRGAGEAARQRVCSAEQECAAGGWGGLATASGGWVQTTRHQPMGYEAEHANRQPRAERAVARHSIRLGAPVHRQVISGRDREY